MRICARVLGLPLPRGSASMASPIRAAGLGLLILSLLLVPGVSAASLMRLHHKYSGLEGSSKHGPMTSHHYHRLRTHDFLRHGRHLLGAFSFPLGGIGDPTAAGLYFTELEIGSPKSSYYAQVDTGSDLLWLGCNSCRNCPTKSNLGVRLRPYDPTDSITSRQVSCTERYCTTSCIAGNLCFYQLAYGDGSTSEGYLVQDMLWLSLNNYSSNNDSAKVTFGCAVYASGGLQKRDQALDGILGLGQSNVSLIQQLASQGKSPRSFAHCLEGEGRGGGILVIGEVNESGMSYTPLRSNQVHYNVNLKSIQVQGQAIRLDEAPSGSGEVTGTIFDSGTTLAYLPESSYLDLLQQIFGSHNLEKIQGEDLACIQHDGSVDSSFPPVTFTFESGSTLEVQPREYLIEVQYGKDTVFCLGFQSSPTGSPHLTILGDLILQDKLVVYDIDNERIGWTDFNCSSEVTVLLSTGKPAEVFSTMIGFGHLDNSPGTRFKLALCMLLYLLLLIS